MRLHDENRFMGLLVVAGLAARGIGSYVHSRRDSDDPDDL